MLISKMCKMLHTFRIFVILFIIVHQKLTMIVDDLQNLMGSKNCENAE